MNNVIKQIQDGVNQKYPKSPLQMIVFSGDIKAETQGNEVIFYARHSHFAEILADNRGQLLLCVQSVFPQVSNIQIGDNPHAFDEEKAVEEAVRRAEQEKRREEQREARLDRRIEISNLPESSRIKCIFEKSHVLDGNRDAYNTVKEFVGCVPDGYDFSNYHFFLTLIGNCGCGKTHLAFTAAWYNIIHNEETTLYFSVPMMLVKLQATFNRPKYDDTAETFDKLIDKIKDTPLLILDDIGSQKRSEWETATLDMLVDYRYENELPTIFTSNIAITELSPRVASRLSEGNIVKMATPDFRLMKALQRKGRK